MWRWTREDPFQENGTLMVCGPGACSPFLKDRGASGSEVAGYERSSKILHPSANGPGIRGISSRRVMICSGFTAKDGQKKKIVSLFDTHSVHFVYKK